jgi:membrane-bound lytic murein transglycosylase D
MERRYGKVWVVVVVTLLLSMPALARTGIQTVFVVPPELRPQVEFWKRIFATYTEEQVVVHDTEHLDRVYSVLDFRSLAGQDQGGGSLRQLIADTAAAEKERVRALLVRLHQNGGASDGLTADEIKIARLFDGDSDPYRFLEAASPDRIRTQTGLRDRFAAGIEIGHRYFLQMEEIFRAERVPIELTRLPLVESCFNVRAYSKVGAAGIWQFMPSTGRRFMRVDLIIDERRDPISSTHAAARFLRENYERLGSWPLALKAYNHGPAGVARAVRELGTTDIVRIIQEYRGPSFKFASRNFYPEFLAALEVERHHQQYFGRLALGQPVKTEAIPLQQPITLRTAAALAGLDSEVIADLNPSLSPLVESGGRPIPAGYRLRVPSGTGDRFAARYAEHVSRSPKTVRTANKGKKKGAQVARAKKKGIRVARAPRKKVAPVSAKKSRTNVKKVKGRNR